MVKQLGLNRAQLEVFLGKDTDAIRKFEKLFVDSDSSVTVTEDALVIAGNAEAKAQSAQDLLVLLEGLVDRLSQAPIVREDLALRIGQIVSRLETAPPPSDQAQFVNVVDANSDATTWPAVVQDQLGYQRVCTDSGLTYDASSKLLGRSALPVMVGDSGAGGSKGAVPAPAAGDAAKVLCGAGTWIPAAVGSVTSVSVVTSNGLSGTVATATTTPAITLTVTVTGMLKGNGTAISAATAGTDYVAGGTGANTQVAYFTAAGVITGSSNFTYSAGVLTVTGTARVYDTVQRTNFTGTALGVVSIKSTTANGDYSDITFIGSGGNPAAKVAYKQTANGGHLLFGTSNDYGSGITNVGAELDYVGAMYLYNMLILPKTSGYGIKVDTTTPTYPWADIIGDISPKTTGAGTPVRTNYNGNIAGFAFVANDIVDLVFHMPHDYVPGSDIFLHVHWSHNGTAITGNVVFTHYSTYAKGHNQANFPAEVTGTITYNTTNIATTPQYRHRVDELQLSTAGGSASMLNTTDLEVDGLVLITLKLTTLPTITGGNLFIHTADLHYQSTGIGTKAKAPDFWT